MIVKMSPELFKRLENSRTLKSLGKIRPDMVVVDELSLKLKLDKSNVEEVWL